MTTATKTVTNEDLLGVLHDLMQMTSEGFDRLDNRVDGLEERADALSSDVAILKTETNDLKQAFYRQELSINSLTIITQEMHNKVSDISKRLNTLEENNG